ncbi:MAG: carbon-nitrogen hydrolase [Latescibacteria bacterium DG_63]|nr:MAG: carbon-nitrogen hydrolase [Latescibacteria bacterium DG_63]
MKIALIQQRASSDRAANRAKGLEALDKAAKRGAQLVCFSELAFEPFYPQERPRSDVTELAESIPGPTTEAFGSLGRRLGVAVVLNVFERDGDRTYDSSPVLDADGSLMGKTRMVHVPDLACFHEKDYYAPGDRGAPVYQTAYGRIGVAICYDRHYPEYMRALALSGAEIVVVPQAGAVDEWPDDLFEAEMRVAAFQNGYFTALCNRVGKEPKLEFAGESFACNPEGQVIARAGRGTEEILLCDLDLAATQQSPAHRLFLRDRRRSSTTRG